MKYSSWNSVASYLVENIKKKIENGEYGEGSKLPSEKMLSEEYSVGRSSVREPLKMLQAENLIEVSTMPDIKVLFSGISRRKKFFGIWWNYVSL